MLCECPSYCFPGEVRVLVVKALLHFDALPSGVQLRQVLRRAALLLLLLLLRGVVTQAALVPRLRGQRHLLLHCEVRLALAQRAQHAVLQAPRVVLLHPGGGAAVEQAARVLERVVATQAVGRSLGRG